MARCSTPGREVWDGSMMSQPLPAFPYHPDPLATGFVEASSTACGCCGAARGFVYTGPAYAATREDLHKSLCPWCIAEGTAAARFEASFTDIGWGVPEDVPPSVTDEIAHRTLGFSGWQQERWLYHCQDAAAFLGVLGRNELELYPDALECLRREADESGWAPSRIEEYLTELDRDGSPAAYLFRCRHCSIHLAYSDCD